MQAYRNAPNPAKQERRSLRSPARHTARSVTP
jgi:hypothetical protein